MPPRRSRTAWWEPADVQAVMRGGLRPWTSDGALSGLGLALNQAAQELATKAVERYNLSDDERQQAVRLAMLAVLDGLAEWSLEISRAYIDVDLRPNGFTWPSIAGATNRAVDAAKVRFARR